MIHIVLNALVIDNYLIDLPVIFAKLSPGSWDEKRPSRRKWQRLCNYLYPFPHVAAIQIYLYQIICYPIKYIN